MIDNTQRFSSRADNYVRYRAHYPPGVIEILREGCGLAPEWIVADVGSGTGFLAEVFLQAGNRVFGVEPNRNMREAGEAYLADYPDFASVDGQAEATTLPDACVDLVTAGQAFHWFDLAAARDEFQRLLRPEPGGWVAIVYNRRVKDGDPFSQPYEELLNRHAPARAAIHHHHPGDAELGAFFGPGGWEMRKLPNRQELGLTGFLGLTESQSATPQPGDEGYEAMIADLEALFREHESGGKVVINYNTWVTYGRLDG